MVAKSIVLGMAFILAGTAMAQSLPTNNQEIQVGQSIADIFRTESGSDIALVASGFLSPTRDNKNLADMFKFPTDELWLVSLTGKQLMDAFERSLSFYPESCPDMLYFSGSEVTFQTGKAIKTKVTGATINGAPIDPAKSYKVTMPASLARGGLSYFAVWNFQKPEKLISPIIKNLLLNKSVQSSTVRWLSRQSL
jgi:hypothetical protein